MTSCLQVSGTPDRHHTGRGQAKLCAAVLESVSKTSTESTKAKLLASARDLYLEQGLHGVSMRKVAERVQVSAPAIYRYFKSKNELLAGVVDEGFRLLASYLYVALAEPTPKDRYVRSGQRYLEFALENPEYYMLIFAARPVSGIAILPEDVVRRRSAAFQMLVDRIKECMDSGLLRPDDAQRTATTIWAHIHGWAHLYLCGQLDLDEEQFKAQFWESSQRLADGLQTPHPKAKA